MRRIDLETVQTARASTVRGINRRIVLNYVRDRQPISRAEIARHTALQRSTVSTIVEELKGDGLIEEIGAGESTGGRRPTMLRLRAAGAIAIGVDVTPTRTTIVTSDLAGNVRARREFPTDPDVDRTSDSIVKAVRDLAAIERRSSIAGVGVSLPGLVDPATGMAHHIPFFRWHDWSISSRIARATRLRVSIDNDANAAATAELWFGQAETQAAIARDFILVLVSEGVGTGIVFDGGIYRGARGAAGEFGHMIVGTDAPVPCSCGNRDCWEAFASGRAAVARYLSRTTNHDPATDANAHVTFEQVIDRALAGETAAIGALDETARYLGIGISNLIVGFSPETVIVGGALTRAWSLIHERLTEIVGRSVRRGLPSARIAPSSLGAQPTLMGALSLVLAREFALVAPAA